MKFLTFKEFLSNPITEAALSRAELVKPSKNMEGAIRAQDVYNHIKRGEPLETTQKSQFNGAPIEVEFIDPKVEQAFKNGNADDIPTKDPVFRLIAQPEVTVRLSELQKTKEFGSSKGSGGGAASTAIVEALQCVYFSYVFNISKSPITDDLTTSELEEAFKYVRTPKKFEKLVNTNEYGDDAWQKTFKQSANDFYRWYKSNRSSSGPFFFHRDSKFMNQIYKKFRDLQKDMGLSLQNDKWNPGDVWLSTSTGEGVIADKYNTLNQYNTAVNQAYMSGDLMGISLKKLSGTDAKLTEYNIPNSKTSQEPVVRLMSLNGEGGRQSFFNSAKLIVETQDGRKIDFRSFNRDQSFQGEIKGKAAAGGKVSHGPINDILKMLNIEQLPPQNKITSVARNPKDSFYREFYSLFRRYAKEGDDYTEPEFIAQIESMKPIDASAFRFSKYMACRLYDIFASNRQRVGEILDEIFSYAASSTKVSSAFIKIH